MSLDTYTAEAAYLTKTNIVHPGSAAQVTAAEAAARTEIAARKGLTVSGGSIKRG